MAGPKSRLGQYLEGRKQYAQQHKKKIAADNDLKAKKSWPVNSQNESGYITENRLDRKDAGIRRNDRNEFKNRVNEMIGDNELAAYDQGFRYKDYTLDRKKAESRYAREQKKKRKGILEK